MNFQTIIMDFKNVSPFTPQSILRLIEEKSIFEMPKEAHDTIDIYEEPRLHVKVLKPLVEHEFRIELYGRSIDRSIINGIRLTIMRLIPIYAFHRSKIFIDSEKSYHMYNNDMLYNAIETLPIFDIDDDLDLESPNRFLTTDIMKKIFHNFLPSKKYTPPPEELFQNQSILTQVEEKPPREIEISIHFQNNKDTYHFVSTHDLTLKIDGKVSNSYTKRRPISFMVLKPKEEIHFRAEANLGISAMMAIYDATTPVIFTTLSNNRFQLFYETIDQIHERQIFIKSLIILIKKLNNLKVFIANTYEERSASETIELGIHGEEYALGNLIVMALQKCQYVDRAGFSVPHVFVDYVSIQYKLKENIKKKPIALLQDVLTYLIKVMEKIHVEMNRK